MMQLIKQSAALAVCLTLMTPGIFAGEEEDIIIDKMIAAYGGDKLLSMKTLGLKEHYKRFRFGQSTSPSEIDLSDYTISIAIDFENKRKGFRNVINTRSGISLQHQIFNGKTGYSIDHGAKTVDEDASLNYVGADRRLSYTLDTVLVRLINDARDSAAFKGVEIHQGVPHEKITFQAAGNPELTLLVDKASGLISKMTRPHWKPGHTYGYSFSNYKQQDGVTYATEFYGSSVGKPLSMTLSRSLQINADISSAFEIPTGYKAGASELDFSEMTVKKLASGIYHAGQDWGFSIFIDMGDHFVASGGYINLKERFEAVQAFAGVDKPLKYQIVSHHHRDHQGGMQEAAAMGVTFITVKEHVATIREQAATPLADDRFMLVDGDDSLFDGKVRVVDVATGHSNHNLVSYFPEAKIAFSADHFYSRQKSGAPEGGAGLVLFRDGLAKYKLDIERFAAAHSGRVLTSADLEEATKTSKPEVCPADWEICTP